MWNAASEIFGMFALDEFVGIVMPLKPDVLSRFDTQVSPSGTHALMCEHVQALSEALRACREPHWMWDQVFAAKRGPATRRSSAQKASITRASTAA
jgi:hypothetical protein